MSRTCHAPFFFCFFAVLAGACADREESPDAGQEATTVDAGLSTGNTLDNEVGSEAGASSNSSGGSRAAPGSGGVPGTANEGKAGAAGASRAGVGGGGNAGRSGSASSGDADAGDATGAGECVVGGCSNQLCTDAASGPVISTCEWREAYGCYRSATCERQSGGPCGWTQTPELMACLREAGQP